MQTLYISQQGCTLSLQQNRVLVKHQAELLDDAQLPLLEQILIFGRSQATTPLIQACLKRQIPIVYLSQTGQCYGRLLPLEKQFPRVIRCQHLLEEPERLAIAQQMVWAKLKNCRVLLMRQRRRLETDELDEALVYLYIVRIAAINTLADQALSANSRAQLMGFEGAGAAQYFSVFGSCLSSDSFTFTKRTRRPPKDQVNAMLGFGYQLIWNHLLVLIDLQGMDPYCACLHEASPKHAALASDLIEEFRAPMVDSLVLYLVNRGMVDADTDFDWTDDGCYLNQQGRKTFLQMFIQRMSEMIQVGSDWQPRWHYLTQQVKEYARCMGEPTVLYRPYLIR